MPWQKTRADRQRDAQAYGPEYKRNRAIAWRRADGRCEQALDTGRQCRSRDRSQVDHIKPVSQGGTHHLDNLRVLCKPHHDAKTATEGGGYRARKNGAKETDPPVQERTRW